MKQLSILLLFILVAGLTVNTSMASDDDSYIQVSQSETVDESEDITPSADDESITYPTEGEEE